MDLTGLPGAEMVEQGLNDLERGADTIEALMVSISAPRLQTLGFIVTRPMDNPELRLYRKLAGQFGSGAHARYNALRRRMVSFQRAAACAR